MNEKSEIIFSTGMEEPGNCISDQNKVQTVKLEWLFSSTTVKKKFIVDVLNFINTNYMGDISLTRVAAHVHVHPVYLGRVLRKELGLNFSDILLKVRVENAKVLLKSTTIKSYEIANIVGIRDPHYFSLVFKKYTGMSPTEFREQQ